MKHKMPVVVECSSDDGAYLGYIELHVDKDGYIMFDNQSCIAKDEEELEQAIGDVTASYAEYGKQQRKEYAEKCLAAN